MYLSMDLTCSKKKSTLTLAGAKDMGRANVINSHSDAQLTKKCREQMKVQGEITKRKALQKPICIQRRKVKRTSGKLTFIYHEASVTKVTFPYPPSPSPASTC